MVCVVWYGVCVVWCGVVCGMVWCMWVRYSVPLRTHFCFFIFVFLYVETLAPETEMCLEVSHFCSETVSSVDSADSLTAQKNKNNEKKKERDR
jgi:hypothetical protein